MSLLARHISVSSVNPLKRLVIPAQPESVPGLYARGGENNGKLTQ